MSYIVESKEFGRFTATVWTDDRFHTWGDVLCDEPILIFTRDRHGRTSVHHDGAKTVQEYMLDVLRLADESGWTDVLDALDADWRWTDAGRLRVDSSSLASVRYFKDAETAVRSVFRADFGADLRDFRLHQFCTRDGWTYAVWNQEELDSYAGVKDAKACTETVQAFLDGDVYLWTVEDADGEVLESCGGYIGDARDVLSEAEAEARRFETDALVQDAQVLEASRADLYADA